MVKVWKDGRFLLLIILLLAAFLRFYGFPGNLRFDGELGHNYLAMKNIIANREIPLLGPPTSHPWLSFGPLFYWLFVPVLYLAKFDPVGPAVVLLLFSIGGIALNYYIVLKYYGRTVAVISSFIIAMSPLWIEMARGTRFYSLTTFFFYPFLFYLIQVAKKGDRNMFWLGFWFSVILNFHLSILALVPGIVFLLLYFKAIRTVSRLALLLLGLLIPNIPFLLYNLHNNFTMLSNLALWIPYRFAGFLGLSPKNNLSAGVFSLNLSAISKFLTSLFVVQNPLAGLGLVLFIAALVHVSQRLKKNSGYIVLVALFISGITAIFIHGDPPIHYFLPLFPVTTILVSVFLARFWEKRVGKVILAAAFLVLLIVNLNFYLAGPSSFPVPYKTQQRIARAIIADSKGSPFSLKRVGPYDYFEGDFAQNYRYLLWLYGNEPVEGSSLVYTIREVGSDVSVRRGK